MILKHALKIIPALILLSSCHTDRYDKSQAAYPDFAPDTAIGNISLYNSNNVIEYFGVDVMKLFSDEALPAAFFLSADSSQLLEVIFHPGSNRLEFSEFGIEYACSPKKGIRSLTCKEFVTESGICLGISPEYLLSVKGEPDSILTGDEVIFHYTIDDLPGSGFLQHYHLPVYYAYYVFVNNKLKKFKFGFEYP